MRWTITHELSTISTFHKAHPQYNNSVRFIQIEYNKYRRTDNEMYNFRYKLFSTILLHKLLTARTAEHF